MTPLLFNGSCQRGAAEALRQELADACDTAQTEVQRLEAALQVMTQRAEQAEQEVSRQQTELLASPDALQEMNTRAARAEQRAQDLAQELERERQRLDRLLTRIHTGAQDGDTG